jgi:hypothetical protein
LPSHHRQLPNPGSGATSSPHETAFDFVDGDILLFWQPTWNFNKTNFGARLGLGFTGGLVNSNTIKNRENYGTIGLDLTRLINRWHLSGWGITPAVYHNWQAPAAGNQTSFGIDVHTALFKNRVRMALGVRDAIDHAGDPVFFTIGIADLPGLVYWMTR